MAVLQMHPKRNYQKLIKSTGIAHFASVSELCVLRKNTAREKHTLAKFASYKKREEGKKKIEKEVTN